MPFNLRLFLSFALLISILGIQGVGAQSVTVKVSNESGQPVQGVKVSAYTNNMCTQPKETNNNGKVEINTSTVKYLLAFDPGEGNAPAVKSINYSSDTYSINLKKRLTKGDAKELVNNKIEAIKTTYDVGKFFDEVTGRAASSGPALGVPGIFSMTPVVNENGEVGMKPDGAMIRGWQKLGRYLVSKNCPYEHNSTCVKIAGYGRDTY